MNEPGPWKYGSAQDLLAKMAELEAKVAELELELSVMRLRALSANIGK